ncbi:hypothetical protein ABIB53_002726 [Janibacter sp. UYMM211]
MAEADLTRGTPATASPVRLDGLRERVESVARSRIDPPLHLRCLVLPDEQERGHGFLWVEVPASQVAPHMVEGAYFGRGDTQKRTLSDPEVLRMHDARRTSAGARQAALRDWVADDHVPAGRRLQAHFHFVAAPTTGPAGTLGDFLDGVNVHNDLYDLIARARAAAPSATETPHMLGAASTPSRTSDGIRLASFTLPLDSEDPRWEDGVVVELGEDACIRVRMTRVSAWDRDGTDSTIWPDLAVVLTRHCVQVVALVADLAGYRGRWSLGAAVTGVAGHTLDVRHHPVTHDLADHHRTTEVSGTDLHDAPGTVTRTLMRSFARATHHERHPEVVAAFADPGH